MTQEQIMKGNKLIAEFIGAPKINAGVELYQIGTVAYPINTLQYHTSWDWLMPVVEKIRCTKYSNALYEGTWTVMIIDSQCIVCEYPEAYFNDGSSVSDRVAEIICNCEGESSIAATHKAVVEFIRWYNSNKQP